MAGELTSHSKESGKPNPASVRSTLPRVLIAIVCLSALMIILGFVKFMWEISTPIDHKQLGKADAVVVLTGSNDRIRPGFELLQQGLAKRLLVSGVHHSTSDTSIQRAAGAQNDLFECCVDIDRLALDTIGNATYTARWVKQNKFNKLIIVTSNYHMPRSLMLMQMAMPAAQLTAAPVHTLDGKFLSDPGVARVLMVEYAKYVAAWVYGIFKL